MAQPAPTDHDDEIALIDAAKADPREFGELYDRYFGRLYRFAYSRVRDQAAAEDITSEVFVKALAALPRFSHTGRPFHAWLYRIAMNAITDSARNSGRTAPLERLDDIVPLWSDTTGDRATRGWELQRAWRLVARLPRDQKTALTLKFREDLATRDIAFVMGRSTGAVKLLLHRALVRLRRDLYELDSNGVSLSMSVSSSSAKRAASSLRPRNRRGRMTSCLNNPPGCSTTPTS